jgi:spermidine dehydrogenase
MTDEAEGSTTRREFFGGLVGTVLGAAAVAATVPTSAAPAASAAAAQPPSVPPPTPAPPAAADYPPLLQGLRGQNAAAMQAAHALRDGKEPPAAALAEPLDESYDLIVVGAGMSGLSAAYFFRKTLPNSKVLILDACDDFGGHARRNEFNVGGRQVLSAGGTYRVMFPTTYTPEGKALLADIGLDAARYYQAAEATMGLTAGYKLQIGMFFDRETYGVDRMVTNSKDFTGAEQFFGESGETWAQFLARTPLSKDAKHDILVMVNDSADHMPGISVDAKIERLRKISYTDYLKQFLKIRHEALSFVQNQMGAAVLNVGAGPDSFSAWRAYNAEYPGFKGMNLPPIRVSDIVRDDQIAPDIHLPDGNAGLARLLVRWLIPGTLPGQSMEDSISSRVDYSLLDCPGNDVRIRLSSTVIRAQHEGDSATARSVAVTYVKDGKFQQVRAAGCVLACFNAIIPYLCPELPESQKQAQHRLVRKPLVLTTVALTNWHAFAKQGVQLITSPNSFYYSALLELGCNLGAYRGSLSPDEPATVIMMHAPSFPGMSAREQFRAGRAEMMGLTVEDFEHRARDQLERALGASGFDSKRDIAGITVNLWAHGYACGDNDLYDPDWSYAESSWVKGRQRFGRIAIANSDAAGVSMTQAAIDQANRAVKELIDNVVEPTFFFSNPARG